MTERQFVGWLLLFVVVIGAPVLSAFLGDVLEQRARRNARAGW